MFARRNVHFEALAQRLLAAPGRMFMHVPPIVRMCGGAQVPGRRYLSRCVSSRVLKVYDVAAALFGDVRIVVALLFGQALAVDPTSISWLGDSGAQRRRGC